MASSNTGMDYIFRRSEICAGTSCDDESIARGVVPVKRNGGYGMFNNMCTDVDFFRPVYPNAWQVDEKESWPPLTGHQQFYLDQDWFLAAGEGLGLHKDPPPAGGGYRLSLSGEHTRWSIHTIWRTEETTLRLHRAEPVLYMSKDDAAGRQIADHDRVRVFNDAGSFACLVKLAPSLQPGQAVIYHAWENFQFAGHRGQQEPIPSPWKTLHLAGGYGQLH